MSKSKDAAKAKAKKSSKALSSVKSGSVVKSSQTPKSKSKDIAKKAAAAFEQDEKKNKHKKDDGEGKKKKKKAKEPTPPPESSESESESESDSDESVSSVEHEKGSAAVPANGSLTAKKALAETSSSSSSSEEESDEESEDEKPAPKKAAPTTAAKPTTPATKATPPIPAKKDAETSSEEDESESGSDETSESESDDDEEVPKQELKPAAKSGPGAQPAQANGSKKNVAPEPAGDEDESDDESDESESASSEEETDESEESSDDDAEEAKKQPVSKKRAPEDDSTVPAKKVKADSSAQDDGPKTLFVGNLSWNVDEEWLRREFDDFGELAGVRIISDRNSGRSKGYGYVEFTAAADAAAALKTKKGAEIDGRTANVDFSTGRPSAPQGAAERAKEYGDTTSPQSDTLFVGNISFDANEDLLAEEFGQYGSINQIRLPTDPESGNPRGFGYVQFASTQEAAEALKNLNGKAICGRPVRLDFSIPRQNAGDSPRGGRGRGGRGGFGDRGGRGGGRGGRGGFGDRGGRGGGRGGFGRGSSTNRGGFGDFRGQKTSFD